MMKNHLQNEKISHLEKQKIKSKLIEKDEKIQSNCSSDTQQLNKQINQKQEQSQEDQNGSLSQQQKSTDQKFDKQWQSSQPPKTAIQLAYDKKPPVKGARRCNYLSLSYSDYKDGEVYYRTATKFFQPQKHYFHKQESSIIKTWQYGSGKTNDRFLISSWNINGIRNALHKPSICEYIKSISLLYLISDTNADILCMIEVKINQWNYRKKPVKLPGYEGYWNFCKCSSGYSGIAVFSKFQPISAFQDFQQRQFSQQGRVLTLEFELFFLVVAYIPTAGQNLERLEYKVNQFEKVFYKHCTKLLGKKHVIVCGDLNVCHTVLDMHVPKIIRKHQGKHPSSTKKEKKNFQSFLNVGFVDTFRRLNPGVKKYSWYNIKRLGRQKNLGKRLDYFLVNEQLIGCITRSEVLNDIEGSDHCPIELNVNLGKLQKQGELKRREKIEFRQEYIRKHFIPKIRFEQKEQQKSEEREQNIKIQQSIDSVKKYTLF